MAKGEQKRPTFLQKAIEQAIGKEREFGSSDDPAATKWPNLWGWLTGWEVGKNYVKSPPSILIRMGPGGVLATITDRDLGKALDANCTALADVFDALEAEMAKANPRIRDVGKGDPKIRKRKTGD